MINRILIIGYVALTLLFFTEVLMTFKGYSFYGYYSGKIINWSWLIYTAVIIIRFWKQKPVRIGFFALLGFIVLSIVPMGIPFFGMVNYFSTLGDYQQLTLDKTYRIERTQQNALSMPEVCIFERSGLLEKHICRPGYREIVGSLLYNDPYKHVQKQQELPIQKATFISVNEDSIGIEYQISGKTKIVYHELNSDD